MDENFTKLRLAIRKDLRKEVRSEVRQVIREELPGQVRQAVDEAIKEHDLATRKDVQDAINRAYEDMAERITELGTLCMKN